MLLWLANCYFTHDSSGFPVLLPFFDAPSGGSFHPFPCYPGPPARTWRYPFHRCGVASPQTPTPAPESLPATIPQSLGVGPYSCRLEGTLDATNSTKTQWVRNVADSHLNRSILQRLSFMWPRKVNQEGPPESCPDRW